MRPKKFKESHPLNFVHQRDWCGSWACVSVPDGLENEMCIIRIQCMNRSRQEDCVSNLVWHTHSRHDGEDMRFPIIIYNHTFSFFSRQSKFPPIHYPTFMNLVTYVVSMKLIANRIWFEWYAFVVPESIGIEKKYTYITIFEFPDR